MSPWTIALVMAGWTVSGCGDDPAMDGSSATEGDGGSGDSADAGGDGDDVSAANCEGSLSPGLQDFAFTFAGVTRHYKFFVPVGYDPAAPTPLVLNFHGFGSNAGQQVFFSDMNTKADEAGFLVAYPDGLPNDDGSQSWNAGTCCADDLERDDVGFARALVDHIEKQACVDPDRVFSTGMSNGGYMSFALGCEAADWVAAIAPVSGALGLEAAACQPSRPISTLVINGTADPLVDYAAASASVDTWKTKLGCTGDPTASTTTGTVTCDEWDGCDGDATLMFCTAEGMGHCWPGQTFCIDGESTDDIIANDAMWTFFQAHPRP